MKNLQSLASLFLIAGLVYYSFYSLMPQEGSPSSVSETKFSTERALIPLKEITKAPHYIGTTEHTRVREYLIGQLEELGLETEVQEGFVINPKWKSLDKPKNIIAQIKGSENGKSLLLLSHYDSALTPSYGASDAGSGVVTILETLRAYKASGKKPKNDIIVLFTDAEEVGLDGARLFVKNHPWAKNVGIALNFEARGSGGPSNMIVETNGGNKNLIKAFMEADVTFPVASSLMYSIYKMLPNDTDSTVLREGADIDGFFFAFIDGARATIAVAPQILVPTAINNDKLFDTLNLSFKSVTIIIDDIIHGMIMAKLLEPYCKKSTKLSLIPRNIIPSFSKY